MTNIWEYKRKEKFLPKSPFTQLCTTEKNPFLPQTKALS